MNARQRYTEAICCLFLLMLVSGCNRVPKLTTQSPEALRAYQEGLGQYEKFYYREAKASFEEALRKDSTFAMAWTRMAQVNWAGRDEEGARQDIDRAMRLAVNASEREQMFIRAWNQVLSYNTNGALATADSLVTRYPDEKEAYLLRGNLYENHKNLEAAIQSYQQAISVDTAYAQAVMSLGYVYSTSGEPEKAAVQMQKYIRLAPDAADPRASYADILVRVGRYDEALAQYRKSLELKPDYWYAIREIGNIYAMMGRLREAEEQFHASLKLVPQNRQLEATHAQQDGLLNIYRGKYEDAVGLFNKALTIDSNNLEAAAGSVYALAKLKKFKEANEVLARIKEEFRRRDLGESPYMLGYHLMQSRLLTEHGDLAQALTECDSALGFSTVISRPSVYRQIAEINRREKAFEPALDACEQALDVNPNSPEALLTLVRIYHDQGDRRMTKEIGGRLMTFWSLADPDYQNRIELMKLLGVASGSQAVSGHY
jgi:tetratricopeptide (TPR) repeat protein